MPNEIVTRAIDAVCGGDHLTSDHAAAVLAETGLPPHANAGALARDELEHEERQCRDDEERRHREKDALGGQPQHVLTR